MQETADTSSSDEEQEKEPLVVILYVAGMSKDIRHVTGRLGVVFKSVYQGQGYITSW